MPFVIILGLFFSQRDTQKNRLYYILLCSIVLIFVAAMRSPEWMTARYGIDTLVYKNSFEDTINKSWDELKMSMYERYMLNDGDYDVGFVVFVKFISIFTKDFYIYSLIADSLFFIPFSILLYRYANNSKQVMFAWIFYIALIQTYLIGGARQILALGFDMFAFLSMIDKKRYRSLLFFVLGIMFHMSSVLFAIPLLMLYIRLTAQTLKMLHLLSLLFFPLVLLSPNELIVSMGNAINMEKYANYGTNGVQGGASTYIFCMVLLSLFCLIAIKKNDIQRNEKMKNFYIMAPLITFFSPLIRSNGSMDRVTLYFYIYLVLLVPYGIECFAHIRKGLGYFYIIGGLTFLSLMNGGLEYYFYWQR